MCGIAGHLGPQKLSSQKVEAALLALKHRGPDGSGYSNFELASGESLTMIHTRLAILDLTDHSHQPMDSETSCLAFNGELYNFKEIKNKFEGTNFHSTGDTEVLLQLLNSEGIEGLDSAEGMWAFAWFDKRSETLHLSRDRFGEKPLFYFQDSTGFYFASEIRTLFAMLERRPSISEEYLNRYLFLGYKYMFENSSTAIEGVSSLEPGTVFTLKSSKEISRKRYWKPQPKEENSLTYNDCVEKVREKIKEAVRLRLRSDVPLAFCLSGGVDSNSLVSLACKYFGYNGHAFTVRSKDLRYNETSLVDKALKHLDIKHTYVEVTSENFLSNLRSMIRARCAPLATISYYSHWKLMSAVKDSGFKVILSGTAADELFSGYYHHHLYYLNEVKGTDSLENWKTKVQGLVRNPSLKDPVLFQSRENRISFRHEDYSRFRDISKFEIKIPSDERAYVDSFLRNCMFDEMFYQVVPPILAEDDMNAMYFSIENRSPFLDRHLFETAAQIPTQHLIKNGLAKSILRDSVAGLVPDEIRLNSRKIGFNLSLGEAVNFNAKEVQDQLFDPSSKIFDYLDYKKLIRLVTEDRNSAEKFLFGFINAKILLDELEESN